MTGWSSAPFLIRDDQQGNKWPFLIGLPLVPKLNDYNLISPAVCKDSSWLVTLLLTLYVVLKTSGRISKIDTPSVPKKQINLKILGQINRKVKWL